MKRGYKETEIGEIPVEWEVKSIGAIAEVKTGGTPSRSNPIYWNGNIPWMSSGEVNNKEIKKTEECITAMAVSNSNAQMLPPETIMMALNGQGRTRGTVAITKIPLTCNQSLAGLVCNKEMILPYFAFHYLENKYHELRHLTGEDARNGLNLSIIREILMPLPPLPEQKKIAEILSSIDKAIRATQAVIDQTKTLKQGLLNQLLTKGIGHKKFKMTEIGEIPVEWETVALNRLTNITRGASPRPINNPKWFAKNGPGWIRIEDVSKSDFYLRTTKQYLSEEGAENSVRVHPGDIIMSICGTIGKPVIIGIEACIHDGFVLFRNLSKELQRNYLYYSIQNLVSYFDSKGQPGTQKNLNTGIVKDTLIPLPSLQEQTRIVGILLSADDIIRENSKYYNQLTVTKLGLMQDLLTGKKRVKV
jgi:type I restriction enzyme S subunit